ncbi:hypothetical protein B9T31_02460 [Acinetobacter sp. ANC 4558]|uniref:DUF2057 family protein n=1 Tax=Acinetobacter sp. ANC 4558 TaxID=1977876 RepID=UPI000A3410BC|nr:DUF2057 family protein [Acinetobacter sp. ANC 4558]OTG88392.1 hypothetical protein B9T31_02460 [Acinetobacter sp. ANC 4558]
MLKQISTLVVAMSLSSFVVAAVTLTTPQEIKVEEINGQPIAKKIFGSDSRQFQLKSGINDLEVSYYQYFEAENGIGAHDIVRSAPVRIKTPLLKDNETYTLALIQAPKTNDQAKAFAKQPVFGLYNNKNELLMTQEGTYQQPRGIINAVFGDQNITRNLNENKVQPKAVYTQNAEFLNQKSDEVQQTTKNALNQLILSWKNANKEDRQKFMLWLAEQAN